MVKIQLKSQSAQVILDAALEKGVKVEIISKRFHLMELTSKGRSLFVKGTSVPVNPQPSCFIADNKYLTKMVLQRREIPVPKSWLVKTAKEARKLILEKKLFPCVLKPAEGAHGRQVFANIESLKEFCEILPYVFNTKGEKNVLLEQHIKGKDYRLLVVGNNVTASMERIPAHVIGDDHSNIRRLIKIFNQNPLVGKEYEKPLCKIRLNGEIKRNLKKQKKKLTYIPRKNEKVILRQNANISTGGIGIDVTNKIDHKIEEMAIRAANAIGLIIAGVDIIYNEKTKIPYVLELNNCPGIDIHHYPAIGQARKVADDIVDYLFP